MDLLAHLASAREVDRLEDDAQDIREGAADVARVQSALGFLDRDLITYCPRHQRREVDLREPIALEGVGEGVQGGVALHPLPEVRRAKGPHLPAVGVGRGEAEVGGDREAEDDPVRLLGEANGSGFARRLLDEADREVSLVAVAEGDVRVRGDSEAPDLDMVAPLWV